MHLYDMFFQHTSKYPVSPELFLTVGSSMSKPKCVCVFCAPCRRGAGLPRGPDWPAAHQRGLQAQRGQAVRRPLHRVAVHERLHGATRDLRSAAAPQASPPTTWRVSVSPACFWFVHTDVVYHPWKKEEAGNQTREIMYTISLSNPLAPKTSTVSEMQVHTLIRGGFFVGHSSFGT